MTLSVANHWYQTKKFNDNITLIWEPFVSIDVRCNMWYVTGRDKDMLIDSGMGFKSLRQELALLRQREVFAVASHAHFDHIGAQHEFEHRLSHRSEAPILISPQESKTVWDIYKHHEILHALPSPQFDLSKFAIEPAPPTRLVDEGDEIDLGNRVFKVFHMPGHSPGSVCLFESASKTLFTGDVLYDGELLDDLYHSNKDQYRETLIRLKEIPAETIHCGHYPSMGRQRMIALVDAYIESRGSWSNQ